MLMTDTEHMQEIMRVIEDQRAATMYSADSPKAMIARWVCMEDLNRTELLQGAARVQEAATLFHLLKALEGKTVEKVVLDGSKNINHESPEYNPFGNRFSIKVITK